jgi:predicted DNA-binding transcriptional regulator AlpA
MKEFKTVDIDYMAKILHKTRRTLEVDVSRRPESLPPRLNIPKSRKVLWLESDVLDWLKKHRSVI